VEVPDAGNVIFIALPQKQPLSSGQLSQRAGKLSKQKGFRFDLGDLATHGHWYGDDESRRGRVLTDKDKDKEG
jgi:hypothetical protein